MPEPAATADARAHMLGITTDVRVTLARRKIPLDEVLNLAPGTMLSFETHCDTPLTLEANRTPIATGETVKIGDRFGIRIVDLGRP